jgi:hypothetical protein
MVKQGYTARTPQSRCLPFAVAASRAPSGAASSSGSGSASKLESECPSYQSLPHSFPYGCRFDHRIIALPGVNIFCVLSYDWCDGHSIDRILKEQMFQENHISSDRHLTSLRILRSADTPIVIFNISDKRALYTSVMQFLARYLTWF